MNFFLLLNTKEDIMKNVGNQRVEGLWGPSTFSLLTFFKNIFLFVQDSEEKDH